ncbi:conserved hypothetical protein [Flavobacterium psychrophilum]|uniref:AbiH family protein n=2 Tax=Flavobacterium psychrophilum TaxID=96345 RepID=UPI000B7C3B88|nr:AbiH family protein [Flavobacterium psychrophilum]SNB31207.1 conserved hypothetical protein [Flavobacterium psychrophilum]SNB96183.1 conserved hypothetical protein [Flavobacterium psychrophilum]GEJ31561.1 hypothetical protein FPN185_contig00053-0028 [Flavobacterium psychrophilum]GEJ32607.1 hypothetical protein FPN181_contig00014-0093 [Flavobacterium psychrophilum]GEJ35871.1 hypothetical protein FPN187_contig00022-0071 [Flavobacterium psychrophilum]
MNRIILIGNGFDLAHGINTSYNHFISDYWENTIKEIHKCEINSIFENSEIHIDIIPRLWLPGFGYDNLMDSLKNHKSKLRFKNRFLQIITSQKQEKNWVDIENEYYMLLKKSFKDAECDYEISDLNSDFNEVQKLLEIYLKKVEEKFIEGFGRDINNVRIKSDIGHKIYSDFKFKDFTESSINKKAELEFSKLQNDIKGLKDNQVEISELKEENRNLISRIGENNPIKEIRKLLISDSAPNYFLLQPEEILFLNFNYTFTEKIYSNHNEFESYHSNRGLKKKYIHIHGTTDKYDRNDVIFGFGDEIDEDYKSIENLNNNEYLENIKSIKYLETDNYKQLLEFLNSGDYQIFIFGHSCGISDRTLLSTLFEHKHCASIKPFYHKRDDVTDNYSDIIRNISRNFNSKSNMRDKVVNKEYCESLK